MANKGLYGFFKIGKEEHIEDLYQNGTIFMNPVSKFKKIEDEHLRGDIHEGSHYVEQANFLRIKFEEQVLDLHDELQNFNCQIYREYKNTRGNIYSLYSFLVEEGQDKFIIDKRNLGFGDTCLFIQDPDEFINRIKKNLDKQNLKYHYGFVKYYDYKTFSGFAGVFHKSNKFEYQNEFRFFVEKNSDTPLVLKNGSISDISTKFRTKSSLNIEIIK